VARPPQPLFVCGAFGQVVKTFCEPASRALFLRW
jgi:hypothetical protein